MSNLRQDTSAAETAEQVECQVGRRAEYTQVGDWVLLAPIRAAAKTLYWALSAHVNSGRNDTQVWPTLDMLAEIMGLSRGDKVKTYVDELVAIDAVNVAKTRYAGGLRERSMYIVHQSPPPGYGVLVSLKAFYVARRARIEAAQAGNPQVAPTPSNGGVGPRAAKPQVSPAPPKQGAAAPRNGVPAAPPKRGCNQTKRNEMKNNQPGPSTSAASQPGSADPGWLDGQPPQPQQPAPAAQSVGVQFLRSLEVRHRPDRHATQRLVPLIEALLAGDWSWDDLMRAVTAGVDTATNPPGVVISRIEKFERESRTEHLSRSELAERRQQTEADRAAEDRRRADARASAIENCSMCDDLGYDGRRLCDHNPTAAEVHARGRERVQAMLAAKAASKTTRRSVASPPAAS